MQAINMIEVIDSWDSLAALYLPGTVFPIPSEFLCCYNKKNRSTIILTNRLTVSNTCTGLENVNPQF